jgi:hypothetical protein
MNRRSASSPGALFFAVDAFWKAPMLRRKFVACELQVLEGLMRIGYQS